MKPSISEILENASNIKNKQEKINFLRSQYSKSLLDVLVACYDPNIEFLLPEGPTPYKPSTQVESQGVLYARTREFYIFIKGGNDNLKQMKREMLWVSLLESIDPKDAALLNSVKDKKMPYKGINKKIISEAFPEVPNLK
ncbi:MAG TPA: DUF6433 family protein [Ignavibacteriaceae bacterium]